VALNLSTSSRSSHILLISFELKFFPEYKMLTTLFINENEEPARLCMYTHTQSININIVIMEIKLSIFIIDDTVTTPKVPRATNHYTIH